MNGLLVGIAAACLMFIAFCVGFCLAAMSSANKISELEESTISKEAVRFAIHSSTLPREMQNSTSWNAALLDVETRLGLNNERGRIQRKNGPKR